MELSFVSLVEEWFDKHRVNGKAVTGGTGNSRNWKILTRKIHLNNLKYSSTSCKPILS